MSAADKFISSYRGIAVDALEVIRKRDARIAELEQQLAGAKHFISQLRDEVVDLKVSRDEAVVEAQDQAL